MTSDRPVRQDIQALRALAVALVVVYHLRPSTLTGGFVGVDVFFVISGFLISSHLLNRPPTRAPDFAAFWARRIRRLLPAALLVVIAVLIASRLIAPSTEWARTAREAVASTFYVENWALVRSATDYLAADGTSSPLQHFWSLAVEEQFYLGWPLLVGLAWWIGRRTGHPRRATGVAMLAVVIASFTASVLLTRSDPAAAYFVTQTRLWELGCGGLLAVVAPRLRWSLVASKAAAWAGLATIAGAAVWLDGAMPFPGWRAAVPVLGAILFIAAAAPAGPLLANRPVQWLGDVSYSVYLWHWPLIALAPFALDRSLNGADQVLVAVLTLVLSGLSYRFVEQRWRHPRPGSPLRRPFIAAATTMALVAGLAGAQLAETRRSEHGAGEQAAEARRAAAECFGAGALAHADSCDPTRLGLLAAEPGVAAKDRAWTFANRCFETPPYRETPSCTFGSGPLRIALVGNSHTAHWAPAFRDLDARVTTFLASECTTVDGQLTWDSAKKSTGCRAWGQRILKATSGDQFDLIVTSQRNVHAMVGHTGADRDTALEAGYRRYLEQWTASGARVLVLRDTPFPQDDVGPIPTCVAQHRDDLARCSGRRDDWIPVDPLARAAAEVDGAAVADLNRYICRPRRCDAVVGNVIVYYDGSHLTETYAQTLAPYLRRAVEDAVAELSPAG